MKNYLTEFVGTFFLVLTVGLTSTVSATPLAPLAIGAVLMVMVYMGGPVSGAHYNPAVTLAILLRGKLRGAEALPYWAAQLAGALLASLAVRTMTGMWFAPAPAEGASPLQALLVEFLFTFALALVVLNVATVRRTAGNPYYGLAIGFTIVGAAFAGGPVSGGAFNPAVGAGPILVSAFAAGGGLGDLWLYLAGPFAGAIAATLAFRLQHGAEAD